MTKPNRSFKPTVFFLSLALVPAALLSGCAGSETGGNTVSGDHLTVYSSLPLSGDEKEISEQVLTGQKLALKQSGGKVGKFDVSFVSLNDADTKTGQWTPAVVSDNSRTVASDQSAIAYIGEADPGASVISVPIMNEAGILTVSPLDNYAGLTVSAGVEKGEPDKYYPSGERTFGRMVPPSNLQAGAVAKALKDDKVKTVQIASDNSLYGRSLARSVAQKAKQEDLTVIDSGVPEALKQGEDTKALPQELSVQRKGKSVDAVFLAGVPNRQLGTALMLVGTDKELELYTAGEMLDNDFLEAIGTAQPRTTLITSVEPTDRYGADGAEFLKAYKDEYNKAPGPYATYGYMAMGAVLDSIKAAKDKANDRTAVIDEFFKLKNEPSPLGKYTINADGDISIDNFYSYQVKNDKPVFQGEIK